MEYFYYQGAITTGDMMNTKEKTALISTGLNLGLTAAKFLLFFLTGSMAILAEAWHSFSDIGTSVLVYLAVRFQKQEDTGSSKPTIEHIISLGIGILLFIVAVSLFYKVIASSGVLLKGTVLSGVFFLFFSVGSYFVYAFETSVGKEEKSAALISDGLHSKADMAAAFLTGISLIMYRLGINIDRQIAALITLFILSFAIESVIQFLNPQIRKDPRLLGQYHFFQWIARIMNPESIHKVIHGADRFLGRPLGRNPRIKQAITRYYWLLFIIPLLWYCSTCIVTIGPMEEGIRVVFGKAVDQGVSLKPGLHLKYPWPVEKIVTERTKEIRRIPIGNITSGQSFALLWTQEHGTGEPFLSGDNNYFHPYLILHYRIKDLSDYIFLNKDPEAVLDHITHQVMTRLFATNTFYDIATRLRSGLVTTIREDVQKRMDDMDMGIELLSVNMKDTHPPISVADAFEEVIAAYQEKQQIINQAYGYRNQKLPEARGGAARRMSNAEAYSSRKELQAVGDASRFLSRLKTWEGHREINRSNLYLKEMQQALKTKRLIIVDPTAGNPRMWMGFTDIPGISGLIQEDEGK
ncbi:MAG: FtsH protease activity modulator HflK [bacterium]